MKLANTKIAKTKELVELSEGVFLKMLPMKEMMDLFGGMAKEGATPEDQAEALDYIFDTVIVDEKGNKFDDLKGGKKATEVLPMPTIMDIITLVSDKLNPTGK